MSKYKSGEFFFFLLPHPLPGHLQYALSAPFFPFNNLATELGSVLPSSLSTLRSFLTQWSGSPSPQSSYRGVKCLEVKGQFTFCELGSRSFLLKLWKHIGPDSSIFSFPFRALFWLSLSSFTCSPPEFSASMQAQGCGNLFSIRNDGCFQDSLFFPSPSPHRRAPLSCQIILTPRPLNPCISNITLLFQQGRRLCVFPISFREFSSSALPFPPSRVKGSLSRSISVRTFSGPHLHKFGPLSLLLGTHIHVDRDCSSLRFLDSAGVRYYGLLSAIWADTPTSFYVRFL